MAGDDSKANGEEGAVATEENQQAEDSSSAENSSAVTDSKEVKEDSETGKEQSGNPGSLDASEGGDGENEGDGEDGEEGDFEEGESYEEGEGDEEYDDEDEDDKKVYTTEYLLSFQNKCTEKPEGLSEKIEVIRSNYNRDQAAGGSGPRQNRGGARRGGNQHNRGRPNDRRQGNNNSGNNNQNKGGNRRKGGQNSGGGNQPNTYANLPMPEVIKPLEKSGKGWTRPAKESEDDVKTRLRKAQGLLNKLSRDNFDELLQPITDIAISDVEVLKGVITKLFDKSTMEPHFCSMYAELALYMSKHAKDFPPAEEGGPAQTFLRLLLNKCQQEFMNNPVPSETPGWEEMDEEDRLEVEFKLRQRTLGNMKLIGELFKVNLLTVPILHQCVVRLLQPPKEGESADEENLEVCTIL